MGHPFDNALTTIALGILLTGLLVGLLRLLAG
jgi:hypothetical protein